MPARASRRKNCSLVSGVSEAVSMLTGYSSEKIRSAKRGLIYRALDRLRLVRGLILNNSFRRGRYVTNSTVSDWIDGGGVRAL